MIGAAEMNPNATNVEALNALYSCEMKCYMNEIELGLYGNLLEKTPVDKKLSWFYLQAG